MYRLITVKTIAAMKFVLMNCEFDYLFRTNSSSYINISALEGFVKDLPRELVYGGPPGVHGIEFASGTGVLLSRDLVAHVVSDELMDLAEVDDVAIARSLQRFGVGLRFPMERPIITSSEAMSALESKQSLNHAVIYRLKNPANRRLEVGMMLALHAKFR